MKGSDIDGEDSVSAEPDTETPEEFGENLGGHTPGFLAVDDSLTVIGSAGVMELLSQDPTGSSVDALSRSDGDRPSKNPDITSAVREAFRTGERIEFDLHLGTTGRIAGLATPLSDMVVVQLHDLTGFAEVIRELKRSRQILDTLDDGIYTLDEAFVITSVNDAVTEITGYSRDELVGSHASKLAGDETLSMATEIIEQLRGEDSEVGLIESSIRTANGKSIPIETRFSTVEFPDGDRARVGLVRDVTDRRHHEHALQELNRSARQLLRAEDEATVAETIVDVANAVWPEAAVVVYRFERATSRLEPVNYSGTSPEPSGPGTPEWDAFATGTSTVKRSDGAGDLSATERPTEGEHTKPTGRVIENAADEEASGATLFASLEKYGLLTVEFGAETEPSEAIESVELLAANAVAALGRVEREMELERHREELAARNTRLERAREINDLLRRINGVLVDATTLDEIATAVCDHLVGAEQISFAWFGEIYRSGDGLTLVSQAGDGDGYLDDIDILGTEMSGLSTEPNAVPAGRALDTLEPVAINDVSTDLRDAQWRERALVRGFQSIISVPVNYSGFSYGVLSVYADRPGIFEGNLGALLEELGETIGNALNGLETKRSLRSQHRVELKIRIADVDALSARLAAALGEPVSVEGAVPGDEDESVLYLQTEADPTSLPSAVLAVQDVRSLGSDDAYRAAVTVTGSTLVDRLAEYGADVKQLRATPADTDVTLVVSQSVDVRGLIDALEQQYSSVELLARRDRTLADESEFSPAVLDQLTDRQAEVVETAYRSGYFEWPRDSTGEEVAETLDITQPTFNRHLRTTERTLFSLLFGDSEDTPE